MGVLCPYMDIITDGAETWLRLLARDFSCELSNHAIGSESIEYPSSAEATRAMLRLAYLRGRHDALTPPADFDADVAKVEAVNQRRAAGW